MDNNKKNKTNNNEEKNNNKGINPKVIVLIIVGVVAVLIFAGIIVFTIVSHNNENNINNRNSLTSIQSNSTNSRSDDYSLSTEDLLRGVDMKPIIYIYPEETTELTVKLGKPENITCSYPKYIDGWNVIANPDGKLIDKDTGRELYSLYWEGINSKEFNTNDGFVVKGSETIEFLEEKLAILGLNEIEAEEFIVYWLPRLQENEYNYIRFATMEEINKNMPLEFSVKPDTIIRVLMQYKG